MSETIIQNAQLKFLKVIDLLKLDLATIRTGRATPSLVENLELTAYGSKMHLIELATIHAPEHNVLVITPFDLNNLQEITKAITMANLGLTPVIDNNVIRITVPMLSEERRAELVKLMHQKLESARIMIRQARREVMEEIAKSAPNEDEQKRLEKEGQDVVDKMMGEVELLGENKEKELTTV
ncbi:ribosome recycling factor [Candidatus Gottesmanbacteria bacterium]|nr:ribosome recycling factor [Candidatus Gottesmanbacteria bacterium]